ncbi:arpin-like [Ptychodera flava]|uniref:arpin-like n=1 Tax=Ptychodera flava TaxID=63121 RepID=UPI00396A36B3
MSRLYDNKPLQSIPVINHSYHGQWQPRDFQSGKGILLEGTVESRSRHIISDSATKKNRYYVLHIKIERSHRRKFDGAGAEIEPNFSETKKVSTGYLQSSYRVDPKGQTDRLSPEEAATVLKKPELIKLTERQSPAGTVPLWIEEEDIEKIELVDGQHIRLKTQGDGPFIESITKINLENVNVCNYAGGEAVGGTWTDKIMAVKAQEASKSDDEGVCADDDEWDD